MAENEVKTEKKGNYEVGRGKLPSWCIGRPGPGRPRGRRNFITDFELAWRKVAEKMRLNQDVDEGCIQILVQGLEHIFKGNSQILKDFLERLYGKEIEQLEVEITDNIYANLSDEEKIERIRLLLARIRENQGQEGFDLSNDRDFGVSANSQDSSGSSGISQGASNKKEGDSSITPEASQNNANNNLLDNSANNQ
jgi:hypothetical protein